MGTDAGTTSAEEEPPALAPSRDDTRFPGRTRRRRPRLPRSLKKHPLRSGFTLLFALSVLSGLLDDEQGETQASQPASAAPQIVVDQELAGYLRQVEEACQRHLLDVQTKPNLPIGLIYERETKYTRELADIPVPPTAVNMRLRLLYARQGLDDVVYRTYRRMIESERPQRVYRRFIPEIKIHSGLVHQVTDSFGIRCASRR